MDKKKEFRLIGQGAYGCTIHPGLSCSTHRIGSVKYVSKLQINDSTTKSEIEMGKIIQKIPNYQFFFAPILENCPINMSTIDSRQLEQCKPIAENTQNSSSKTFVSNKIQYVGKKTLGKYFYELIDRPKPKPKNIKYLQKILESHIYLLNSLQILNANGLLHLDIKENNVMYDKINDIFIIIDFGFCIQSKTIELPNYLQATRPFGKSTDSYPPWCIEIHILAYIARYIKKAQSSTYKIDDSIFQQKIISTEELKRICTLFIKKNFIFKTDFFSNNEIQKFETALHKWMDSFKGKTWKDIWTLLVSSHKSWDNYALSVMYLFELHDSNIVFESTDQNQDQDQRKFAISNIWTEPTKPKSEANPSRSQSLMNKYVAILKKIILAFPEKRLTPEETSHEIKSIFRFVEKKIIDELSKMANPDIKKVKDRKDKRTLLELEDDAELRKQ